MGPVGVRRAKPAIVKPPLTLSTWPVMKALLGLRKKAIDSAISTGSAIRRNGTARVMPSLMRIAQSLVCACRSGVSVGPGQTQLTLIL